MDSESIIRELEEERNRLDRAIAALNGGRMARGTVAREKAARNDRKGPGHLSAAARRRISQAMKKRWAATKRHAAAKA